MSLWVKARTITMMLGDLAAFYVSLVLTLIIRYQELSPTTLKLHLFPFTLGGLLWIVIFYMGGLYEVRAIKNANYFYNHYVTLVLVSGGVMATMFYLIPAFGIAPKTNLAIFIATFIVIDYFWRFLVNAVFSKRAARRRLLLIGSNRSIEELAAYLKENPQHGYEVSFWMRDGLQQKTVKDIETVIGNNRINLIALPNHIKQHGPSVKLIYQAKPRHVETLDLATLYEHIFQKVALPELEEQWVHEHLPASVNRYNQIINAIEVLLAALLIILLSPLFLVIAIAIKLTSPGPIIYSQPRVGLGGIVFPFHKFRSMYSTKDKNPDADGKTPTWSSGSRDPRITPVGRFLRWTHLDEFPQLFNIIKGEMAFIGPRPERPEFIEQLSKQIPFYDLRLLARPGITGWAQINFKYAASVDEAYEKLQYDIFYLKNRSLIRDLLILAKTPKKLFVPEK